MAYTHTYKKKIKKNKKFEWGTWYHCLTYEGKTGMTPFLIYIEPSITVIWIGESLSST